VVVFDFVGGYCLYPLDTIYALMLWRLTPFPKDLCVVVLVCLCGACALFSYLFLEVFSLDHFLKTGVCGGGVYPLTRSALPITP